MYHVHVANLGYTAQTSEELAVAIRQLGRDLQFCIDESEGIHGTEFIVELCTTDRWAPAIAAEFSSEHYATLVAELDADERSRADAWCAELGDTSDVPVDWRALAIWALDDWVTGASSCWLAAFLSGAGWTKQTGWTKLVAVPHDGEDMQRCLYMIQRNPTLRSRLPKLADAGPQWARIWTHWAALETAFQAIPKPLTFDSSLLHIERVRTFSMLFRQVTRQQEQ